MKKKKFGCLSPRDVPVPGRAWVGVDSLMTRSFVSLPSWFPADKAAAVLRQQGKEFALVTERTGGPALAHLRDLAAAPTNKSVLWRTTPLGRAVTPGARIDQALSLMDAHASDNLPVVVGGLIVGLLTRRALVAGLAQAPTAAAELRAA
jgi:hypothetical protein